jgi:hypothetical protein
MGFSCEKGCKDYLCKYPECAQNCQRHGLRCLTLKISGGQKLFVAIRQAITRPLDLDVRRHILPHWELLSSDQH